MHTVHDGSLFRVYEILSMVTGYVFSVGFMRSTELWILNGTLSSRALLAVVLDASFGWHCRMPAAEQILLRPLWLFSMSSSGAFLFLVIWYVWLFCAEKFIRLVDELARFCVEVLSCRQRAFKKLTVRDLFPD